MAQLILWFALSTVGQAKTIPENLPEPESVSAFSEYWKTYDNTWGQWRKAGKAEFDARWRQVEQKYAAEHQRLNQGQITSLQKAAEKYRQHLDKYDSAPNRPYVLLNLAQILSILGDHLNEVSESSGGFSKSEALALLEEIERNYTAFPHFDDALYLQAITLESLTREDDSVRAWTKLTKRPNPTVFVSFAHLALGDKAFDREDPKKAAKHYLASLEVLRKVEDFEDRQYEEIRTVYRATWALYRSGEVQDVVKVGRQLLIPGSRLADVDESGKIKQDAIELIGSSLYEANDRSLTSSTLQDPDLGLAAPAIAQQAQKKFSANEIHEESVFVGELIVAKQPLAAEMPEILQLLADSYGKLKRNKERIATLEILADLLPENSLWRSRNKLDRQLIANMEAKAIKANGLLAAHYYESGLNSGNQNAFLSSAARYQVLIDFSPNAPEANTWRLRKSHCQYFGNQMDKAATGYASLKGSFKASESDTEIASYQLVLTREKMWRKAYADAMNTGKEPQKDPDVVGELNKLEQAIDEFSTKYPSQARSTDLLLVGASANRDHDRLDRASIYWQRALVANSSPGQRAIAIRGLIFAKMKGGSSDEVLQSARQFLKLEDWRKLGVSLDNELKGVLSAAALDEGNRLNDKGMAREGGSLLVSLAKEFPDIPMRAKIFRNGAYMLGIAGDWRAAQDAAEQHLKAKNAEYAADMIYLLARAHEFQFRMQKAAETYLDFGKRFPNHPRAAKSLGLARDLALAEGDNALAARISEQLAKTSPSSGERLKEMGSAIALFAKAGKYQDAARLGDDRYRASKSQTDKFESELISAKNRFLADASQERDAIDQLTRLAKNLQRARDQISPADYSRIASETFLLLGDEAKRKFDDFSIFDRTGSIADNVNEKTEYFGEVVRNYSEAAKLNDPNSSQAANYNLGEAADSFADEIGSVPKRSNETIPLKTQQRFDDSVRRLRGLAQKSYSAAVLEARRDPARYRGNAYVKRAGLKLGSANATSNEDVAEYRLPTSASPLLPANWSEQ
jgi:hypothetical protein